MSFRKLSDSFLSSCICGIHSAILNRVQHDKTLDLQIRDNFINIYYRGSNLLKVTERAVDFDMNYFGGERPSDLKFPMSIKSEDDAKAVVSLIPRLKEAIDLTLGTKEKCEREFQQLVSRENNYSPISNDTDYLICDIEYTHSDYQELRFDLIAAKWPSQGAIRKKPEAMTLAVIEKKYGDGALTGSAGLQKHIADLINLASGNHLEHLKEEMVAVMQQKAQLGVIDKSELVREDRWPRINFDQNRPEWILILANHKPDSTILKRELELIAAIVNNVENFPFDIKIATANFMGYGLYEKSMIPLDEFLNIM